MDQIQEEEEIKSNATSYWELFFGPITRVLSIIVQPIVAPIKWVIQKKSEDNSQIESLQEKVEEEEKEKVEVELEGENEERRDKTIQKENEMERKLIKNEKEVRAIDTIISPSSTTTTSTSSSSNNRLRAAPTNRRAPTSIQKLRENASKIEQKEEIKGKRTAEGSKMINDSIGGLGILASVGAANLRAKESVFVAADHVTLKKSEDQKAGPKLIRIRSKKPNTVRVVTTHPNSLNMEDSFILEDGNTLYHWTGQNCTRLIKAKAADITRRINTKEKSTRARIVTMDQKDGSDDINPFWNHFGGKLEKMKESGEEDRIVDNLYVVEGQNLVKVASGKLGQELLFTEGVFILDSLNEIYLWVGKGSSKELRTKGSSLVESLRESVERKWHVYSKIHEGVEPILFKEKFWNFKDDLPIMSKTVSSLPKTIIKEFQIDTMYSNERGKEELKIDDGSGRVTMWYINSESKKVIYPMDLKGHFFAGESFIVLYTYKSQDKLYEGSQAGGGIKDKYILYFWQGRQSSVKKKGWSALITSEMGKDFAGEVPTQIRIPQQKETSHFMSIFGGSIVIHQGTYQQRLDRDISLYQLRGSISKSPLRPESLRSVQVSSNSSLLNSNDVFILTHENKNYLWIGKHSEIGNHPTSTFIHPTIPQKGDIQIIDEGDETEEFWKLLGGKKGYFNEEQGTVKLFHCHFATGAISADRIWDFSQEDLVERDTMILDAKNRVFVWRGSKADLKENKTMELAMKYVQIGTSGSRERPVYFIHSHKEPHEFRSYFHGWDYSKVIETPSLSSLLLVPDILKELCRTFSYQELQKKPSGLDQSQLEIYLSDTDFRELFEMDKVAFENLSSWKKEALKKKLNLF
eukprot:TRINITY_DN1807_c0_g1_i2.p1 TRINITY_DN1807_c0_g1~~TRINITY_DN1807_c0_g1_i2.p1  ORF type:complete len:861 (-),score=194.07 TRINITY_DN1807_c0_g1_i2:34-2616(-)